MRNYPEIHPFSNKKSLSNHLIPYFNFKSRNEMKPGRNQKNPDDSDFPGHSEILGVHHTLGKWTNSGKSGHAEIPWTPQKPDDHLTRRPLTE